MDELQISGKRYISSRRVAQENGYTADYIGQLIRGGKIIGQKVGRAWYVDAVSFDAYLGEEGTSANPAEQKSSGLPSAPQAVAVGQTFAQQDLPTPEPIVEEIVVEEKMPEPAPMPQLATDQGSDQSVGVEAEKVEEASVQEVVPEQKQEEPEAEKIKITIAEGPRHVPLSVSGLRYYADDEPLLPEISHSAKESRLAIVAAAPAGAQREVFVAAQPRRGSRGRALALGALAIAVFAISAVVSSAVVLNLKIDGGNTASVFYTIDFTQ